ncbi:MAG: polysaccharide biosynthesis tyrosine autokinase [Planctomycetes bacterium]|nr:polysaccharide biosynthesis tyrosine autokinase [Planctomycetota bacterium]
MTMIPTHEQTPHPLGPVRAPAEIIPRIPSGGPGGGGGLTPRDIWRIIRKRKGLIITTFLVCVAVVITGTGLWWYFAPLYTAKAYLIVSPPPASILRPGETMYGRDIMERYQQTQAELIQHQDVFIDAAKNENLRRTKWYQKHKKDIIKELREEIKFSVLPNVNLIELSMTGLNRTELADIVNAVADSCVRFARRSTLARHREEIDKLSAARDRAQRRLEAIRREIARLRSTSRAAGMQERRNIVTIKIQLLIQQLSEAQTNLAEAQAAYNAFQEAVKNNTIEQDPQIVQALEFDRTLIMLKAKLSELETNLYNATEKFGPEHRTVKTIEGLIKAVKKQIEDRRKEVIKVQVSFLKQMRESELAAAQQQVLRLQSLFEEAKAEARDLEDTLGRLAALEEDAKTLQDHIKVIDARLEDLQVLSSPARAAGAGAAEEAIVGPVNIGYRAAEPLPNNPSQPKWSIMVPLGIVLGLMLGFGLAFLLELSDTSVKTPSDLARRIDLPLLGMIPHADDLDEEIEDFRRAVLLAPQSPVAEAFRQVRTNLLFSGPAQRRRSILITSPAPGDGRTTVVMNLAASAALAGMKVLVVDANFRRPAIGDMFPQANQAGLSSVLVGQATWREVVSATDVSNLSVITSGPLPPNPAELLGSDAMRQFISEASAEYDQVLFDGSPLMVVSDAVILSTQVDGVVLVVRAGQNSVGIVQRSAERLIRIGAHVFGIVLEAVRSMGGGYLRKNYETFYEYQEKSLPE